MFASLLFPCALWFAGSVPSNSLFLLLGIGRKEVVGISSASVLSVEFDRGFWCSVNSGWSFEPVGGCMQTAWNGGALKVVTLKVQLHLLSLVATPVRCICYCQSCQGCLFFGELLCHRVHTAPLPRSPLSFATWLMGIIYADMSPSQ